MTERDPEYVREGMAEWGRDAAANLRKMGETAERERYGEETERVDVLLRSQAKANAERITPGSPEWDAWAEYLREHNRDHEMAHYAATGLPMPRPSKLPPGYRYTTQTEEAA